MGGTVSPLGESRREIEPARPGESGNELAPPHSIKIGTGSGETRMTGAPNRGLRGLKGSPFDLGQGPVGWYGARTMTTDIGEPVGPAQIRTASARGHQTQWAAQFAVASELCKRGFEVAFTLGHSTPLADLMVISPETKQMFLVDVKGLYRKNPWLIKLKAPRKNLFYILVYVPADQPNEFFVLTQEQVGQLVRDELKRLKRPTNYPVTGIVWKLVLPYKDAWRILPR